MDRLVTRYPATVPWNSLLTEGVSRRVSGDGDAGCSPFRRGQPARSVPGEWRPVQWVSSVKLSYFKDKCRVFAQTRSDDIQSFDVMLPLEYLRSEGAMHRWHSSGQPHA